MSSTKFDQGYFNRVIKKNNFIALGMMDSNHNVFDSDGEGIKFSVDIEEFKERIKEFAYGCEVLTTEHHIKANGNLPFTDKTTVVLCNNVKQVSASIEYKYRRNMKFIPYRDFLKYVVDHEQRRSTSLFFVLNNELEAISRCIDVYEIAQSDRPSKGNHIVTLDKGIFDFFTRKETIKTEQSSKYDAEQKVADESKNGKTHETVINGSMKVIKKVDTDNLIGYKYTFVRYER